MKKVKLLMASCLIVVLLTAGCVHIKTPQASYTRFLVDQKLEGFELTMTDGTEVKLDQQSSETDKMLEAFLSGLKAATVLYMGGK